MQIAVVDLKIAFLSRRVILFVWFCELATKTQRDEVNLQSSFFNLFPVPSPIFKGIIWRNPSKINIKTTMEREKFAKRRLKASHRNCRMDNKLFMLFN